MEITAINDIIADIWSSIIRIQNPRRTDILGLFDMVYGIIADIWSWSSIIWMQKPRRTDVLDLFDMMESTKDEITKMRKGVEKVLKVDEQAGVFNFLSLDMTKKFKVLVNTKG